MSRSPGRLRLLTGTNVANPRSTLPGFLDRITSVSTENGPLGDTAVSSEAAQGESPASAEVPGSVLMDRFKTSVTLLQAVRTRGAAIDWERFVLRYITLLKTWARRWGARQDLVDDMVQQTLLNVLQSMPAFEYDPGSSFRSWLKVVAWRSWRQISRKQQDFPLLRGALGDDCFSETESIHQARSREDLLQMFDKMANAEIFDLACDRARPLFRESSWQAFEMMEIRQRPGEEVAQSLGLTLPAVHAAVYRVRKKVAQFASQLDVHD